MLHSAARPGWSDASDVVQLLLLKGADVDAQDHNVSGHANPEKYTRDTVWFNDGHWQCFHCALTDCAAVLSGTKQQVKPL